MEAGRRADQEDPTGRKKPEPPLAPLSLMWANQSIVAVVSTDSSKLLVFVFSFFSPKHSNGSHLFLTEPSRASFKASPS